VSTKANAAGPCAPGRTSSNSNWKTSSSWSLKTNSNSSSTMSWMNCSKTNCCSNSNWNSRTSSSSSWTNCSTTNCRRTSARPPSSFAPGARRARQSDVGRQTQVPRSAPRQPQARRWVFSAW